VVFHPPKPTNQSSLIIARHKSIRQRPQSWFLRHLRLLGVWGLHLDKLDDPSSSFQRLNLFFLFGKMIKTSKFPNRLTQAAKGPMKVRSVQTWHFFPVNIFMTIHGTNVVFSYIYHKNQPNASKYTLPMDCMGYVTPQECSQVSFFPLAQLGMWGNDSTFFRL